MARSPKHPFGEERNDLRLSQKYKGNVSLILSSQAGNGGGL
jgi:hypothetical protein